MFVNPTDEGWTFAVFSSKRHNIIHYVKNLKRIYNVLRWSDLISLVWWKFSAWSQCSDTRACDSLVMKIA